MKLIWMLAMLLVAGPAFASNADNSSAPAPAAYPPCSAKVTDKCIEQRAIKPPVRKAVREKVVRRDKVHRRKG